MFAVLELGLRLAQKDAPAPELFHVFPAKWVSELDWYSAWVRDHDQLKRTFKAYEIYGLRPHAGEAIRINADGYRETWGSGSAPQYSLGFLGGSTLWGSWSRDHSTIPSFVALQFSELGVSVEAKNYAEVGFVLSQELHRAVRLLSSGEKPDVLVFFDGVNDSLSAVANFAHGSERPAGLPWEHDKYENLFALGKTGEIGIGDILMKFKSFRTALRIGERFGWRKKDPSEKGFWRNPTPEDYDRLSTEVSSEYLRLIESADRIVRSFGVVPVFVLQPLIRYKKNLTSSEEPLLAANADWQGYLNQVYQNIRAQAPSAHFLDYAELFADETEDLFADVIHYSESGNKKIAAKLSSDLAAILKNDQSSQLTMVH